MLLAHACLPTLLFSSTLPPPLWLSSPPHPLPPTLHLTTPKPLAAKGQFEHTLGWLNQWACSRSFGLGTLLPWDPEYLIESLSDSTIYMAYYTVAHLLHEGDMYAVRSGPVDVRDLTNEVWNYIFLGGELPRDTPIPRDLLARARREFEFWYPFDLRVSGKDLIQVSVYSILGGIVGGVGGGAWQH